MKNDTKIIGFENFQTIEPRDLITFSKEYEKHREIISQTLKSKKGKIFSIIISRMNHHGSFGKKKITGTVGVVTEIGFFFETDHDFYCEYDNSRILFISFFNVLGDVPILETHQDINPYEIDSSDILIGYFDKLKEMKEMLTSSVNTIHSAKLFFRYDESHKSFREGNFVVECEVKKVNKSNVEINHLISYFLVDCEKSYVDMGPGTRIQKFIAPECYLHKVVISFGVKNKINPCDEE